MSIVMHMKAVLGRALFLPLICMGVVGCSSTTPEWKKDNFSKYDNIDIVINTSKEAYSTKDMQLEITIENHTPLEIRFSAIDKGLRIEKLVDGEWYYLNDRPKFEVNPAISGGLTPGDSFTFSMPIATVVGKGDYRVCFRYLYDVEDDDLNDTHAGVAYSYFCIK